MACPIRLIMLVRSDIGRSFSVNLLATIKRIMLHMEARVVVVIMWPYFYEDVIKSFLQQPKHCSISCPEQPHLSVSA